MTRLINPRVVLRSLAIILVLCLVAELTLRCATPQDAAGGPLALLDAVDRVKEWQRRRSIERGFEDATGYSLTFEQLSKVEARLFEGTYGPRHQNLYAELLASYEVQFERLVEATNEAGSELIVLYLPSNWNDVGRQKRIHDSARTFFRGLAEKHSLEFIDLTDEITKRRWEDMTLHPRDSHLSRAANAVIATHLAEALGRHREHRSSTTFQERPALFGDNGPNQNERVEWEPGLPFQLTTNSQGLRMKGNVAFPKHKQRVLVLGDSFTFGPHLSNDQTFPAILAEKSSNLEVLNAGYPGYTIVDEADLFLERAKFTEPDIVLLQVLDNDVYGMLSVMRNVFGRRKIVHGEKVTPSAAEVALLDEVLGPRAVARR